MKDDLLYGYYERELDYMRGLAGEFAARYPALAGRLLLDRNQSQDPHVERLIQSFAFVAARLQMRLDDDYPEFADALLHQIHPQALTPVPAATIAQFELDPQQGRIREGTSVPRHAKLLTKKVDDVACQFRTCFPLRLWPLVLDVADQVPVGLAETELVPGAQSALRLRFRTALGEPLAEYGLQSLRLHLDGDPAVVHALFAAMFGEPAGVLLRTPTGGLRSLGTGALREVGFAGDEGIYSEPAEGALGYRLLQEYFAFPEKFLFVDVHGLGALARSTDNSFEILVLQRESDTALANKDLRRNLLLGCVPVVNLFAMSPAPIRDDGRHIEYRVMPDHRAPLHYEVHSVRSVAASRPGVPGMREYRPLFGLRHGDGNGAPLSFFHVRRQQSTRPQDQGTDVFLSLVDEDFRPVVTDVHDVLHVEAMVTNRDLPSRIIFGDPAGDFLVEGMPSIVKVRALRQPTKSLRPRLHGASRWRLVSHLSLNHLAIVGETEEQAAGALQSFRELLRLYDLGESAVTRQRIEGLTAIRGRRVTRLLPGIGAARGIAIDLELDEAKFAGSGPLLFGIVLERFLALFASVNSFTQTNLRVRQREGYVRQWPPRAGERQLL